MKKLLVITMILASVFLTVSSNIDGEEYDVDGNVIDKRVYEKDWEDCVEWGYDSFGILKPYKGLTLACIKGNKLVTCTSSGKCWTSLL